MYCCRSWVVLSAKFNVYVWKMGTMVAWQSIDSYLRTRKYRTLCQWWKDVCAKIWQLLHWRKKLRTVGDKFVLTAIALQTKKDRIIIRFNHSRNFGRWQSSNHQTFRRIFGVVNILGYVVSWQFEPLWVLQGCVNCPARICNLTASLKDMFIVVADCTAR